MIVDDFHVGWAGASLGPFETDPSLVVDPDAPLPLAATLQGFKPVAGAQQIPQTGGRVELVQLARGGAREAGVDRNPAAPVESLRSLICEANDQRTSDRLWLLSSVDTRYALRQT